MKYTREELIADAKLEIQKFIDSGLPNQWVKMKMGSVYLRACGYHNFFGFTHNCFDIVNIQVNSQYQGQGLFTEVMEWIIQAHKMEYTYVESVLNLGFQKSLERKGWTNLSKGYDICLVWKNPNFIQPVDTKQTALAPS